MNNIFCRQIIALGNFGFTGFATAKFFAFFQQFRPGRTMNRQIHPAAAGHFFIGGINNRLHLQFCYIPFYSFNFHSYLQ